MLRHKIRQSFKAIETVKPGAPSSTHSASSSMTGGGGGGGGVSGQHHSKQISSILKKPCVGIHVRNGDALMDSRGQSKIDRTLAAHVQHAQDLIRRTGAVTVFIASDNATAIDIAPRVYPQYHWMTQRRPIKQQEIYDVRNEVCVVV